MVPKQAIKKIKLKIKVQNSVQNIINEKYYSARTPFQGLGPPTGPYQPQRSTQPNWLFPWLTRALVTMKQCLFAVWETWHHPKMHHTTQRAYLHKTTVGRRDWAYPYAQAGTMKGSLMPHWGSFPTDPDMKRCGKNQQGKIRNNHFKPQRLSFLRLVHFLWFWPQTSSSERQRFDELTCVLQANLQYKTSNSALRTMS